MASGSRATSLSLARISQLLGRFRESRIARAGSRIPSPAAAGAAIDSHEAAIIISGLAALILAASAAAAASRGRRNRPKRRRSAADETTPTLTTTTATSRPTNEPFCCYSFSFSPSPSSSSFHFFSLGWQIRQPTAACLCFSPSPFTWLLWRQQQDTTCAAAANFGPPILRSEPPRPRRASIELGARRSPATGG